MHKINIEKVKFLVDELGWDYQRMTEGGQEIYDMLCNTLGLEEFGGLDNEPSE